MCFKVGINPNFLYVFDYIENLRGLKNNKAHITSSFLFPQFLAQCCVDVCAFITPPAL